MNKLGTIVAARWRPAEQRIYKPRPDTKGSMLKMQLRIDPKITTSDDGREFINPKEIEGGLFFELVPQGAAKTDKGDATFDYESDKKVIAMLGMPDVTKLLTAFREVRVKSKTVPESLRRKVKPEEKSNSTEVHLFHKTPTGGSCAISWTFEKERSFLKLSRSAEQRQQITLTLDEELIVDRVLNKALDAFTDVGF